MARISLETQLAKLRKAKEDIIKKEKALLNRTQGKVIARIVQLATDNSVSAAQILEALKAGKPQKQKIKRAGTGLRKSGAKVSPKYRNPDNPNETWTGRGRAPLWAKARKEAGTLDATLIPQST